MTNQVPHNYHLIAKAIAYIRENFKEQPSLNDIAQSVDLSSYHFQRIFTDWAGVSPKKFMQYNSIEYAKQLLKIHDSTLFETSYQTGLSGTSRLHDLFISIEGMTPGEFKNGGESLRIQYSFADSPFGEILVASTLIGICHLAFIEDKEGALNELKEQFPNADYLQSENAHQKAALGIFQNDWRQLKEIKLHLKGTPFQLKVWQTLLKIPKANLSSYGAIAKQIDRPKSARAIGTAIGSNPVAYLIPCHRVIQSSGLMAGYRWGNTRKSAIIGWEAAKLEAQSA